MGIFNHFHLKFFSRPKLLPVKQTICSIALVMVTELVQQNTTALTISMIFYSCSYIQGNSTVVVSELCLNSRCCIVDPVSLYQRWAMSISFIASLEVLLLSQKMHRRKSNKNENFNHCGLRQVTDAFASSLPLLNQLLPNKVP